MARIQNLLTMPSEGLANAAGARGVSAAMDEVEGARQQEFAENQILEEAARKNAAFELNQRRVKQDMRVKKRQVDLLDAKAEQARQITEASQQAAESLATGRLPDDEYTQEILSQATPPELLLWQAHKADIEAQVENPVRHAKEGVATWESIVAGVGARDRSSRVTGLERNVGSLLKAGAINLEDFWDEVGRVGDKDFNLNQAEARYQEIIDSHANEQEWIEDVARSSAVIQKLVDKEWIGDDLKRSKEIQKALLWDRNLSDQARSVMHGELKSLGDQDIKAFQARAVEALDGQRDRIKAEKFQEHVMETSMGAAQLLEMSETGASPPAMKVADLGAVPEDYSWTGSWMDPVEGEANSYNAVTGEWARVRPADRPADVPTVDQRVLVRDAVVSVFDTLATRGNDSARIEEIMSGGSDIERGQLSTYVVGEIHNKTGILLDPKDFVAIQGMLTTAMQESDEKKAEDKAIEKKREEDLADRPLPIGAFGSTVIAGRPK